MPRVRASPLCSEPATGYRAGSGGETSAWPPFTASPQWDLLLCQRGEMDMAGLKLGEPPRKFLKSKHHTGQTKAPNADRSLFTVVIHNKILFATICASLSHWNEEEKKCGESVDATHSSHFSLSLSGFFPAAHCTASEKACL